MGNGVGTPTNGPGTPAPTGYAPVSQPVNGQMNPSPLQGLDASAIQTNGGINPFALGNRSPGNYVPQPAPDGGAAVAPPPRPMMVPNGGFPPPTARMPLPAPTGTFGTPRAIGQLPPGNLPNGPVGAPRTGGSFMGNALRNYGGNR